jgi:hypothetical protein
LSTSLLHRAMDYRSLKLISYCHNNKMAL